MLPARLVAGKGRAYDSNAFAILPIFVDSLAFLAINANEKLNKLLLECEDDFD